MNIGYTKSFIKNSKKLPANTRAKLRERIKVFSENPTHAILRNHQLKGAHKTYRSIDITGDVRALYLTEGNDVIFDQIGTHSQLYG